MPPIVKGKIVLDFAEEIIEFKLRGKEYRVNKPTNGDIKKYKEKLNLCESDDDKENALKEFLESLGLTQKAMDLMTPKQLELLIKNLYESEKN